MSGKILMITLLIIVCSALFNIACELIFVLYFIFKINLVIINVIKKDICKIYFMLL